MLGAIIGDIAGSVYEWDNIKTKEFPLLREDCYFTDDTVMTVATADAVMNGGKTQDFIDAYYKWGHMYPDAGYGRRFYDWLYSDDRRPYNSWGNGSAMRVSPCAWVMSCGAVEQPPIGWELAARSAEVTHNHPEGVKGAEATATAIFLARQYAENSFWTLDELKTELRGLIEQLYGYDLSRTLDEIRPSYEYDISCQGTVPQAITAFLESTDFEDAIRNAISLGGDSDTLTAITGSIAEAAYGIPEWIEEKALSYLSEPMREVCRRWREHIAGLKA